MTSNIRTIQDFQTITRQENSTQTFTYDSNTEYVMDTSLRNIASTRLALNDYRLPYLHEINEHVVVDSRDIEILNSNLDNQQIQSILENLINRTHNPSLVRSFLSNISPETLQHLNLILNTPNPSLSSLQPYINILMYTNTGIEDLNITISYLNTMINDILLTPISTPNLEIIAEQSINAINTQSDSTIEENNTRGDSFNRIRSSTLNSLNWRSVISRSGSLLVLGLSAYLGQPYIGAVLTSVGSTFSNSMVTSLLSNNQFFTNNQRGVRWDDVSDSFYTSWEMFFRYLNRRSD